MTEIAFKTTNQWKIQGSPEKGVYISFVAPIDGWKKYIVFNKKEMDEQDEELFWFLWEFTEEERIGWEFLISTTRNNFMNNVYASEILEVKDDKGEIVFPWQVEEAEKKTE